MCSDVTDATFGVDRSLGTRQTSYAPSTVTVVTLAPVSLTTWHLWDRVVSPALDVNTHGIGDIMALGHHDGESKVEEEYPEELHATRGIQKRVRSARLH